jgi:phosphate-selective porin OprO/OprP
MAKPLYFHIIVGILLIILLGSFFTGSSSANEAALEELIGIFEKKGFLAPQEGERIRKIIAEDRNRLLKKEKELEEKEKALISKEKELQEREKSLSASSSGPSETVRPQKGLPIHAVYEEGVRFSTQGEEPYSLVLRLLLQSDYRYFDYSGEDAGRNKFDLRRLGLIIFGSFSRYFDYMFGYEFQGLQSRRVVDAYVDAHLSPYISLRFGQFKEPFSLEQYTGDASILFVERSMGYYLTPQRDVGLMAYASLWDDRIVYGLGIFNGDGGDDAPGGGSDDPEITGRILFSPFRGRGAALYQNLQIGGSFGYAHIDRANVNTRVRTTGLTPVFDLSTSAKVNAISDVDNRTRLGAELGWTDGPLALTGEYIHVRFRDLATESADFDLDLEEYYIALLWMITGETPALRKGVIQPLKPRKSLGPCGWGGLGLAVRYDLFSADDSAYETVITAGESVREVEAYTIALKWYLNPVAQIILDATRSSFDRPLVLARDPFTGAAIFSDHENVFTGRFQMVF